MTKSVKAKINAAIRSIRASKPVPSGMVYRQVGNQPKKVTPKMAGVVAAAQARKTNNFGPVATITTAPVAIGNSVRGSKTLSTPTREGVRACGRDFMFSPTATGSITTWTLCGGSPLSPAAFSDSTLRQYMQMYQHFRWIRCVVHYITSSPTSSSGDVMFYYGKNRDSVFLNQTSSQLLPFVMSDENTVIGPQWTNHSAELTVTADWKSTDYGMSDDVNDYAAGELFLLSKTSTTDSPGYVVFDYEIEFRGQQISPRLLSLPLPRAQWFETNLGASGAVTINSGIVVSTTGNGINGSAAALPSGYTVLDVYKVVFDITNSSSGSWVVTTPSTLASLTDAGGTNQAITLSDGFTCYAVAISSTQLRFYPNSTAAYAQVGPLVYQATATITYNIQTWMSLIGTINTTNLVPNY